MTGHAENSTADRRRIVLLGASNLSLGLSTVWNLLHESPGGRLDVLAAAGHGRSYGSWSRVLFRELPGIVECGLWDALAAATRTEPLPTYALITDVGNDLVYSVPPKQIAAWVTTCIDRLQAVDANIVATSLPIASLESLSKWRFVAMRTVLFPRNRSSLAEIRKQSAELNERLAALASDAHVALVEPPGEWYGFDPIHIRRGARRRAWQSIVQHWSAEPAPGRSRCEKVGGRPALRRWLGRTQHTPQPVLDRDGSSLSLY